jgi:hypothetical protein
LNAGIVEEAGQTTRGVVEALKANPIILALVLLNIILFAAVTWSLTRSRDIELQLTLEDQKTIRTAIEHLAGCVNPELLKGLNLMPQH